MAFFLFSQTIQSNQKRRAEKPKTIIHIFSSKVKRNRQSPAKTGSNRKSTLNALRARKESTMNIEYKIITRDGEERSVTPAVFYDTLYQNNDYELCDGRNENGGSMFLLQRDDGVLTETSKLFHQEKSKQWAEADRRTRCVLPNGSLCRQPKRDCESCSRERSSRTYSIEARAENGIQETDQTASPEETVINDDFIAEMHSVLELLEDAEKRVIKALYGVDEPALSLRDIASAEGIKYSMARSIRDRAFRHLTNLAAHLKEYIE